MLVIAGGIILGFLGLFFIRELVAIAALVFFGFIAIFLIWCASTWIPEKQVQLQPKTHEQVVAETCSYKITDACMDVLTPEERKKMEPAYIAQKAEEKKAAAEARIAAEKAAAEARIAAEKAAAEARIAAEKAAAEARIAAEKAARKAAVIAKHNEWTTYEHNRTDSLNRDIADARAMVGCMEIYAPINGKDSALRTCAPEHSPTGVKFYLYMIENYGEEKLLILPYKPYDLQFWVDNGVDFDPDTVEAQDVKKLKELGLLGLN